MRNWRKWREGKEKRSELARRAAETRWARVHAEAPLRERRVIEITIRDSHRMRTVIRAEQLQDEEGRWSRLRVEGSKGRPVGRHGLGLRVAAAVL